MHAITSRTGKINSSASPTNGRLLIHLGYRNSEKFGSGFPCVNIGKDFSFTLFGLFHSSKCLFDSLQRDDRDAIAIPNDEITATYWHATHGYGTVHHPVTALLTTSRHDRTTEYRKSAVTEFARITSCTVEHNPGDPSAQCRMREDTAPNPGIWMSLTVDNENLAWLRKRKDGVNGRIVRSRNLGRPRLSNDAHVHAQWLNRTCHALRSIQRVANKRRRNFIPNGNFFRRHAAKIGPITLDRQSISPFCKRQACAYADFLSGAKL
jgi:hypothetical protein